MEATVYVNGIAYQVDGQLYSRDSGNGWLSVNQWTKIYCDVLQVFYPQKYGIEKPNYYRLEEGDRWVTREELVKMISPEIIRERKIGSRIESSMGNSKWENEPGHGPDWIDW